MSNTFDESQLGGRLLTLLSRETGNATLAFVAPPTRVRGGNDTLIYGFELDAPPERFAGPLILRTIPEDRAGERAVWEAAVQEAVSEQGFPAPRPRLASADLKGLGRAFLIMDRLPGRALLSGDFSELEAESRIARGWFLLRTLLRMFSTMNQTADHLGEQQGRLHALDPETLRRKAERAGIPQARFEAAGLLDDLARSFDTEGFEGLRPGVEWLRANVPPETGRAVICHGDFLPVNLLAEGGEVTAVLDWSTARVAPPAFDVGSTTAFVSIIPGVLPRPVQPVLNRLVGRFLRRYRGRYAQHSAVSERDVQYWAALRWLQELSGVATHRTSGSNETREQVDGVTEEQPGLTRRLIESFRSVTGITPSLPSSSASRLARSSQG